jgi:manganese/zinc/iron transport system ATP- binding protein
MRGMTPALEVRSLSVSYGARPILSGVSFSLRRGELVALIGPNGAGKSTLLKAACSLIPYEGDVLQRGQPMKLTHSAVSYLPQRTTYDLGYPITARQVVLSARRRFLGPVKRFRSVDHAAADQALERVGLGDIGAQSLETLSGGQLQRVLLARSLAQEAEVLLLDEALSGVDAPTSEMLLGLLGELCSAGAAIIVATHDLALTRRRFQRCLGVNGVLVADGSPTQVLDETCVERLYGPAPLPIGAR